MNVSDRLTYWKEKLWSPLRIRTGMFLRKWNLRSANYENLRKTLRKFWKCGPVVCCMLYSALVIDRHTDRVLKVSAGKSLGFSLSVRSVMNSLMSHNNSFSLSVRSVMSILMSHNNSFSLSVRSVMNSSELSVLAGLTYVLHLQTYLPNIMNVGWQ